MKSPARSRIRVRFLMLVAALAALLAVYLIIDSPPLLQLQHAALLRLESSFKVTDLEVADVGKMKMFLHPNDPVITYTIMLTGVWEANETHWISRLLEEGDTFVDIGANVGYYTLIAARIVGETGRVYAFEPDPTNFAILEKNVRLNGLRNVILEQKAVSNTPGSLMLFLHEGAPGDHRIYQFFQDQGSVEVEAVTLDDYFENDKGGIDFAKIDTQGAEGLIVEGMRDMIDANQAMTMTIEFWPFGLSGLGSSAQELLNQLSSSGFRYFDLGMGNEGVSDPREAETAELLTRFTIANQKFTNLLLLRKAELLERLTQQNLQ